MQSVINDRNRVSGFGTSMKFNEIGDKIEGTLIDKRLATVPKYMVPTVMEEKMVYELNVKKGGSITINKETRVLDTDEKWAVWGKPEGRSGVDTQMKTVKLGQIVGFVFEGYKPNPKFPKNPTHVIQVYQDKNVVDEDFLTAIEAQQAFGGTIVDNEPHYEEIGDEPIPDFGKNEPKPEVKSEVPFESGVVRKPETAAVSLLEEISKIAKAKLGAVSDDDVKLKVMEATKLAFLEVNYQQILEALSK